MSSATTQKQPAAIIIKEGSLSLGKRKRQTTSKDDQEILHDLAKQVLQQKLSNIISDNIKKYNKEEMAVSLEAKKTCQQGSLEMVKKDHSNLLYEEHKNKALSQQQQEEQQSPENDEDEANLIDDDEDRLRMTSAVAIASVLRDDIPNDLVYNSLKQAAMDATTAVSNVSALVRMTLLSLTHPVLIRITKILPKSFTIRNREPLNNLNKIMVGPPNFALKEQLNKLYKPNTRAKDLQEICTNVHLQFIQSHHLGNKKDNNNDTIHPLWVNLIFKKSNLPSTGDGSSITTATAVKEFNTNLQNRWSGTNIYAKSQRYLIRILLRVLIWLLNVNKRQSMNVTKWQSIYGTENFTKMMNINAQGLSNPGKSCIGAKAEKDKDVDRVASNLGPGDLVKMWEGEVEEEEEEAEEEEVVVVVVEEEPNAMEKGTTSTNIIPSAGRGSRSKGKSVALTLRGNACWYRQGHHFKLCRPQERQPLVVVFF
ncbi:hypothetical protein INT45_003495 [Circinella minor]|uniref:Uncharacterized protein n=1 Tax=Circinella minor TaxID=1195481 RepID=A0A8H7S8W0_9FUNG|nr:hypothetical protein INT45_003495 [Circinella minor]